MAHEAQVRYSNLIDLKLRKSLVTIADDAVENAIPVFNTRYEGDPTAGSVKIPVRDTEVTVGDYNKATGIALSAGATAYITVTIDNDKAVNELIDGYDAASVPDDLVADRLDSAAYGLKLVIDQDAIATLEAEGTTSTDTALPTEADIYDKIVDENTLLSEANVPRDGRVLLIKPAMLKLLKKSDDFLKQSDIAQELVMEGVIGMVDGLQVRETNNLDANTDFIISHFGWCTRIEEWSVPVKIQDLSGSGTFIGASAVQGRKIYKHKVTKAAAVRVKTHV